MTKLDQYLEENDAVITTSSASDCIELFTASGRLDSPFYYFRGHSNSAYRLMSTLDRFGNDKWSGKERLLIRQFKKFATGHIQPQQFPSSTFEWLSLMQHYGAPTRLLDLTTSPYIALYFAVSDYQSSLDAAVWAINPSILHDASLQRLEEAKFPLPFERMHGYHLPQFLQESYFSEAFLSGKYRVCMIAEPEQGDRRLLQQQGAFLVSSAIAETTEDVLADVLLNYIESRPEKYKGGRGKQFLDWNLVKVVVPASIKKALFRQLLQMNINAATLFPDLTGIAKHVAELVSNTDYIGNRWTFAK